MATARHPARGVWTAFAAVLIVVFASGCFEEHDPITQKALDSEDPRICLQHNYTSDREECLNSLGSIIDDPDKCSLFPDDTRQTQCLTNAATRNKDPAICEKFPKKSDAESCLGDVAFSKGDSSMCEQLTDESSRDACLGRIGKFHNKPELCNKINSKDLKDDCYGYSGTNANSTDLCDKIEGAYTRDKCNLQVGLSTREAGVCNKLGGSDKSLCLASIGRNPEACSNLTNEFDANRCYLHVGINAADPESCNKVNNSLLPISNFEGGSGACFTAVAADRGNELYCGKMGSYPEEYKECVVAVASKWKRPELCDKVKDFDNHIDCVGDVAVNTMNVSVCDSLSIGEFRDECRDRYARTHPTAVQKVMFAAEDAVTNPLQEKAEKEIAKSLA
ncbi:Uncharacterised protein [uncultured archaeon]|nr:Uncharacterised protein [uncultured archaeon]